MATSKAAQRAVNKYMRENYDRVNLTMPKGKKEKPARQADQSTREDATRRGTVIITRPSTKYKEEIT